MQKSISFYLKKPKYWLGLILFQLIRLIGNLPLSIQVWLGRLLGKMMHLLASRRRLIAQINLKLCFPEMSEKQRALLLKENFALTGLALVETAACWFSSLNSRHARTTLTGEHHLKKALAKNKGVILLSFHLTSLETGGCLLGRNYPITAMYKPNKNQLIEDFMCTGRQRHIKAVLQQNDVRGTIKALRKNEIVWYATDQNYGTKSSVFVPFFGIQAATITATTKFAKLTGATVIPFTQARSADGKHFELTLHPELDNFPSTSEAEDAARINLFLENYLRQQPADYMWLHQRFRTRPANEKRLYPKRG